MSLSPAGVDKERLTPMKLTVSIATDLGLKREHNEDSFASWMPEPPEERERSGALLVVADGMGGSKAGEVASRLAADTMVAVYRDEPGDDPLARLAQDRKSTRLNSSHIQKSRMPSSA